MISLLLTDKDSDLKLVSLILNSPDKKDSTLFTDITGNFNIEAKIVDSIDDCDLVLYSRAVKKIDKHTSDDLKVWSDRAYQANKKLLVFVGGDMSHRISINFTNIIVLKGSQYRHLLNNNEIIVPPFIEDLYQEEKFPVRTKTEMPTIGFCGWADMKIGLPYLKAKTIDWLIRFIHYTGINRNSVFYRKGVFIRGEVLKIFGKCKFLKTNFIIRNTFSANKKTMVGNPELIRKEYLENMSQSDLILCPKGDGNFSLRFFETLSVGRVPILIDTDTCLPLEGFIDYSCFVLKVPYNKIDNADSIILDFWKQTDDLKFIEMQKLARENYLKFLRYDAFFNVLFDFIKTDRLPAKNR